MLVLICFASVLLHVRCKVLFNSWCVINCRVAEGSLQKVVGRRLTDRYVFLFDGLIILTKQNKSRISVTGPVGDYKLKEKYHVRLLDITDRDDTDGRCFLSFRISVVFTTLHGMPAWTTYEKALCQFVRLSVKWVDCDKTEESLVQIFIPYER